MKTLKVR